MSPVDWTKTRSLSFWLKILAVVVIVCFGLSIWTVIRQSQASAARTADRKAQNTTQVAQCFQSIRNAPAVISILDSLDVIISTSITSSKQALKADPAGPLAPIRRRTIARLTPARNNVRDFRDQMKRQTPTVAACNRLAERLDVNPQPFKPKPPKGDAR